MSLAAAIYDNKQSDCLLSSPRSRTGLTSRQIFTKIHNLPQLTARRRRLRSMFAEFCAICSIYIMSKALGDILTVSILIGGCVFYSPSLPCACRHFAILRGAMWVYSRQNGGTHKASLANKKCILRLKYLRSKYRLELWA